MRCTDFDGLLCYFALWAVVREEFWAEIQRQGATPHSVSLWFCATPHIGLQLVSKRIGLQLHIRRKIMAEKAFGGLPARNRTAMAPGLHG